MAGNRYFPSMRKSAGSLSRYIFSLQSAVATFIADYLDYVACSFLCEDRYPEQDIDGESIHIGQMSAGRIKWDVCYLSLRINDATKMDFFIRADYSVSTKKALPKLHQQIFWCTIWAAGDHLAFELAEFDGSLIQCFWLDRKVVQGTFRPVVDEIRRYIHAGQRRTELQKAEVHP
jgi:hypothetical protein